MHTLYFTLHRKTQNSHKMVTESKFLGKDGLTQTSANHISNIAKEMYESLEAKLDSIRLVSCNFTLAAAGNSYPVSVSSSKDELDELASTLGQISRLKALIAWLREGIKAKTELCSSGVEDKYIARLIKEGRADLAEPEFDKLPTVEFVLASKPEAFLARYYALEAKCATFGKYIHPDGHLAKARKEFYDRLKNPTEVRGRGNEAEIHTYSTAFRTEEVDQAFFELQKKHRAVQADFNAMKAEVENEASEQEKDYRREFLAKMDRHDELVKQEILSYREQVKALKIVIPESLKEVYESVNAVASCK